MASVHDVGLDEHERRAPVPSRPGRYHPRYLMAPHPKGLCHTPPGDHALPILDDLVPHAYSGPGSPW
jgi:hypothetical protein